jgi:hypothetical protein
MIDPAPVAPRRLLPADRLTVPARRITDQQIPEAQQYDTALLQIAALRANTRGPCRIADGDGTRDGLWSTRDCRQRGKRLAGIEWDCRCHPDPKFTAHDAMEPLPAG